MSAELAYDLDNFAAKTEEEHDEELKASSLRLIKNRRQEKVVAPVKLIMGAFLVVVIATVMIYSQVVLTELTAETNEYESLIGTLDTEYMRLGAELEASTSIKTLEEAAEKSLGLSKIDSSQIEYVNLTGKDEITVAKTGGKYLLKEYWQEFVDKALEYLPF